MKTLLLILAFLLAACDEELPDANAGASDAGPALSHYTVITSDGRCVVKRTIDDRGQIIYFAQGGPYTACALSLGPNIDASAP